MSGKKHDRFNQSSPKSEDYIPRPRFVEETQEVDTSSASIDKDEESDRKYILVWHSSIVLESQIFYPGDEIGEDIYNKMPQFLKIHWWEIGRELPPHVFAKLSRHLQKHFKEKSKADS